MRKFNICALFPEVLRDTALEEVEVEPTEWKIIQQAGTFNYVRSLLHRGLSAELATCQLTDVQAGLAISQHLHGFAVDMTSYV